MFLWLFVINAWATLPTLYEKEPNNTPLQATPFSGETLLTGLIKKGDQDAYMWILDKDDSKYMWDLELTGVANAMTRIDIMKVIFTPDGTAVEDYKKFFSFGTRTGSKPVHLNDLLFDEGEYLIAITSKSKNKVSQAQSYQLILKQKREVSPQKSDKKERAKRVSSRNYYPYIFEHKTGWFMFSVDKQGSHKLWTLSGVTTIGHQTQVSVEDKDGNVLGKGVTNKFGKYKFIDMELEEGKYFIKYSGNVKGIKHAAKLLSTGTVKIDANEVEPNNEYQDANAISYKKTIHGKADRRGDHDVFKFLLPKKYEDKIFDITLDTDDKGLHFVLLDADGDKLHESKDDSNFTMSNLSLKTGKPYYISIYTDKNASVYSFKLSELRDAKPQIEIEPNDELQDAYSIEVQKEIKGFLEGYEDDCFVFDIVIPNRLWNIAVSGEKVKQLELYKAAQPNNRMFDIRKSKNNPLELKNLLLLPGKYGVCLGGKNASYTLQVDEANLSESNITSLADIEHEPNQDKSQTNALHFGQTIKGTLENRGNEDYFHFTLYNDEHIRLTGIPPEDGDIRFKISSNLITHSARPKIGEKSVLEGVYPPGRYTIEVWTDKTSVGLYSLKLERLNRFDTIDIEPNDDYNLAGQIPHTFALKGHSNTKDDDYYKFPSSMTKETNITISGENLEDHIRIYPNSKDSSLALTWDKENKTYSTKLLSPSDSYIVVDNGIGYYEYNLSFTEYKPHLVNPLNITVDIKKQSGDIAAYSGYGQKINVLVDIYSEEACQLSMVSHISDKTWKLDGEQSISLKANEKKKISLSLMIPKNIENRPVVVSLKFSNESGDFKTVSLTIHPKLNVSPLNTYDDWGLPESLLGGFNVARLDFGAQRVLEHNETELGYVEDIMVRTHMLFDNFTYKGKGFHLYSRRKQSDENVTIKLQGDTLQEVVGVILNPVGERNDNEQLKTFSVALSKDGKQYKTVYSGVLGLQTKDQAFAFDNAYKAKYARLTLHSNYANETKGEIGLGEWKVIAKQESVNIKKPFNIANPKFGGHVVKASEGLSTSWDSYILTPKYDIGSGSKYLYKKNKTLSWVVGFKNERMAKITALRWREPKESKKEKWMKSIHVLISTQTPNGPWEEISLWIKADANVSLYVLKKPLWARYVKFVYDIKEDDHRVLPEILQIFEAKPSTEYKSILGEWGEKSYRAFYEYKQEKIQKKISVIKGNETKEHAYALEMNQTIKGRVSVFNHEEDWYKMVIEKENVVFTSHVAGKSSVDVLYELYDSNGTKVVPIVHLKKPQIHTYRYDLHKGTYWAKVKQPPVSVIFAWDNSGSVSPYHAQIFNGVNNYTQTIQPHIDAVNLLCFNHEEKFILDDFSDKPAQIQTIFNNFNRDCDDSDAERPLRKASEVLKNRDGIKGVIIIGDAVGSRDIKLWNVLKEVNPKVFSIRVQSQYRDNQMYEGIMQSWSRVNNGTYNMVSNGTELYKAINRASAILRRPVYYTLKSESKYKKPKGPGTLAVMFDKRKKAPISKNFAVELILDASGSMLQRIGGKRRIAIARDVLKKAVRDIIPAKTLVALRVFGHKQADSCRTDLEVKLQPLNTYKMMGVISRVNAKNLAKTPIADSLAKVASDLKEVKGKKVVILVTDGKETCEGNPAKVIANLKAQGIDIRVNIVGFAIDNKALKEEFKKWASIGNGSYFDARDQRSLDAAVKKALQVPFKIYNQTGKLMAKSMIGSEPIQLPAGVYKIVIEGVVPIVYEGIVVKGEEANQVILQQGGIN
jgi:hypothetical protein